MPKEYSRTTRLAEQIQRELAQMIQFGMKDPRLGMVTLNHVKVAKDLGYADIYFTVMGAKGETEGDIRKQTSSILNDASGYLRSELSRILSTRITPHLRFHYDETLDRGMHLTSLIKKATDEDKSRHHDDESGDAE
ncbi:30S ribosome-binding factor RbfA [Thalassolituus sp. LLYu03]|uniref:30S ribosome-binding factor RbfA n=1 Tax=Thalassolituus sp. LLYu03 TaxID=3421656 RepID=UPI003D27641A